MPPASLRDLPVDERPRERLLIHGSAALSDGELVAILLRTGTPGHSVLAFARLLLRDFGGLIGLQGATSRSLRRHGLGDAKIATLLAALEIGRRFARLQVPERDPLGKPFEMAQYLALRYCGIDQEVMGAVFLDRRRCVVGEREIFRGTMSRMTVEPRTILKEALMRDAAALLLFHTHPNGDPSPSVEDLLFTRHLFDAAAAVGVELIDHLILAGSGRWVSLQQHQGW